METFSPFQRTIARAPTIEAPHHIPPPFPADWPCTANYYRSTRASDGNRFTNRLRIASNSP